MSEVENMAAVRRLFEECWMQGNFDAADELLSESYVIHDPSIPGITPGTQGYKIRINMIREAVPDIVLSLDDMFAEGDKVVTRWTVRGTNGGFILGIPPTNKPVTINGVTIDRLENGKIAEAWQNWDVLGMMQQIGLVPQVGR